MHAGELYEVFVQWAAYQCLHERLGGDARRSDPRDLIGKVAAYGHDRAAAAIFADCVTSDLDDAAHVLRELLELAADGRRPRYGNEVNPDFHDQLTQTLRSEDLTGEGIASEPGSGASPANGSPRGTHAPSPVELPLGAPPPEHPSEGAPS